MNSTSAWLCLNYYIFHTIFKLVGTRLTGHIRRLHTNKTNLGMIARGRKWLYFKQWKQTFPFTLKSAFPWLNHASAFSWQQRLATLTLTPSFQRDHQLVELLHALGQTSLIQSEPVLANPSKGHHSSVTTKAAHSLQWREKGVAEAPRLAQWGWRSLYCYMHHKTKETRETSPGDVLSWRCLKAWNAHNSFKMYDTTYQHGQGQDLLSHMSR